MTAGPDSAITTLVVASLNPYDLIAPSRLLFPGCLHDRRELSRAEVRLGSGEDSPVLTSVTRGPCRASCRGSGEHWTATSHSVTLRVPCDSRPHCGSCECDDAHVFSVTPDAAEALKAALP